MGKSYDELLKGPQVGVSRSDLNPEERVRVYRITVTGAKGQSRTNTSGRFASVSYIEGDLKAATAKFVAENRRLLADIDFTKPNSIQTSTSQEVYDWILHWLDERTLEVLDRVIYESRETVDWILSREKYHAAPNRRYTTGGSGSLKLSDETPEEIFDQLPAKATIDDLPDTVTGDRHWLFAYFDEHPKYDCIVRNPDDQVSLWKPLDCFSER